MKCKVCLIDYGDSEIAEMCEENHQLKLAFWRQHKLMERQSKLIESLWTELESSQKAFIHIEQSLKKIVEDSEPVYN